MTNTSIKKASIKDGMFLVVEYSEVLEDGTNTVKKDCTAPVHDDLRRQFKRLTVHLALLCAQVREDHNNGLAATNEIPNDPFGKNLLPYDPEQLYRFSESDWNIIDNMYLQGFQVASTGDNESVTLMGYRTTHNSKTLSLTSPSQKFENDRYAYPNISELHEIVEACKGEVHLYLFEGKHQPEAQLDLFADDDTEKDVDTEESGITISMGGKEISMGDLDKAVKKIKKGKKKDTSEESF